MQGMVGFSTGCIFKVITTEAERINIIKMSGARAIELNFVKSIDKAAESLKESDLQGFDYVSLHAPVIKYKYDVESERVINAIRAINSIRRLDLVVFHPDTVEDFNFFNSIDIPMPIAFENMDNRKASFRWGADLARLLDRFPGAGMVLDVNHAFTNDPTLSLTKELYRSLGHRIVQVHLSGYAGYHEALFQTRQAEIIKSIENPNVPIIIESQFKFREDFDSEMRYVERFLGEPQE